MSHVPPTHVGVARVSEQLIPQLPQSVSVVSGVSHPFSNKPSQSPKPAMHAKPHTPSLHAGAAFGRSGHSRKHVPQ